MPKKVPRPKPEYCEVVEKVTLTMTNRTALATVRIGTTLKIQLRPGPPPFLVVVTTDDSAVGAAVFSAAAQVAECIQHGYVYVADVLAVRGTHCKVCVRRKWRGKNLKR
jgi:hypothetical protein